MRFHIINHRFGTDYLQHSCPTLSDALRYIAAMMSAKPETVTVARAVQAGYFIVQA